MAAIRIVLAADHGGFDLKKELVEGLHELKLEVTDIGAQTAGIRAANCTDVFSARFSRAHNDSNVLTLGGRVVGVGLAWEIVNVWLQTQFEGGERHLRRLGKIERG
jgi:ribose 5-phosphate isomerase RpiB